MNEIIKYILNMFMLLYGRENLQNYWFESYEISNTDYIIWKKYNLFIQKHNMVGLMQSNI